MRFDNGSSVNPNHHIQCQGTTEYMQLLHWYDAQRKRPRERPPSQHDSRAMSPILQDRSLSRGEKKYLTSIARIYSVSDMKQLKQNQYHALVQREMRKGYYKEADWDKYRRYLNTPRKTQFGPCDPFRGNKRSISAPGQRSLKDGDSGDESRPQTTPHKFIKGSKDNLNKSGSRPSERRAGNQEAARGRPRKGEAQGKKQESLVGKPARVESPLPPLQKANSNASLSSLEDEQETKNDNQRAEDDQSEKKGVERTDEKKEEPAADKKSDDESENRAKGDQIEVQEVNESEDNDERSKMSARDTDERRGEAVEYHPTYTERVGESEDRSLQEQEPQYAMTSPERKGEKQEDQRESPKPVSPQQLEPPPSLTKGAAADQQDTVDGDKDDNKVDDDNKSDENKEAAVTVNVKGASSDEDQKYSDEEAAANRDDGFEGSPELMHHAHKEGKDRPMSRIGGREQFMVITKKDAENSDDDYSDDEDGSDRGKNRIDETRGINDDDQIETNYNDSRAGEKEEENTSRASLNMTKDTRASEGKNDRDQFEMKLKALPDDNVSNGSLRQEGEGSGVNQRKGIVSPTEASSHEKPSEISTLEY